MLPQLIDDVPVETRIRKLCRSIVVVHKVNATRCGFALFPAGGQRAESLQHDVLGVKVARYARIVPRRDAGRTVIEVDLSLWRCACFCATGW